MSTPLQYAGYRWLQDRFQLIAVPHWVDHQIGSVGARATTETVGDRVIHRLPKSYDPGTNPLDHLVFALKYQGVNLATMRGVFLNSTSDEVSVFVQSKPTGKYHRLVWFYYEFLMDRRLPIGDAKQGGYVEALDPSLYYTAPSTNSKRHRVKNNLLGPASFCPVVRRTDALDAFEKEELSQEIEDLIKHFDADMLSRSVNYLYSKETKASYDIEREDASSLKIRRFLTTLSQAGRTPLSTEHLVNVQNSVVDPRFAESGFREDQVYVGETRSHMGVPYENVHYVAPRPVDAIEMMGGLMTMANKLSGTDVPAVIQATAVSFGFVYIHPFDDGNGRTHRYLIHDVLSANGFTPRGVVIPVSVAILGDTRAYDTALEVFSNEVMQRVQYDLSQEGEMEVTNDLSDMYRYLDLTVQAEYLCAAIKKAIEEDFVAELSYLSKYDRLKEAVGQIVDLPSKKENVLLNCLVQNGGILSRKKRGGMFSFLSEEEVAAIEKAFVSVWDRGCD